MRETSFLFGIFNVYKKYKYKKIEMLFKNVM